MVKPTFNKTKTPRVNAFAPFSTKTKRWRHTVSKAAFVVHQKDKDAKDQQLAAAVEWCKTNDKRGWSALKTGGFPLLKDARAINNRLDGKVQNGNERQYCQVLTEMEENSLVRFVVNKNRACQGVGRKDIEKYVLDLLKVRQALIRKFRGRKVVPLSNNAKTVLSNVFLSNFGGVGIASTPL